LSNNVIPLIPNTPEAHRNFWNMFANMYSDPRNFAFRKLFDTPEYAEEKEKLFTVHPELKDFKPPETEGMLVVNMRVAFESGKMHATEVEDWLEQKLLGEWRGPASDFRIDEMSVNEVLPPAYYRKNDVFDNPISVQEIEEW
jgi:hypothetical protein